MRIPFLSGVLLLAAAFPVCGQIQPTNSLSLSLKECVERALAHNLDIRIRRLQPDIDQLDLEGARGAYDPALNLSANQSYRQSPGNPDPNSVFFGAGSDTFTENFSTGVGGKALYGTRYQVSGNMTRQSGTFFPSFQYTPDLGVSLAQPLLKDFLIDADRRTIAVARHTLRIDEQALRAQIMNTIAQVARTYYDVAFARDNVRVQEASLILAERLLAENRRRIELGAMAPLDEKQAESQVAARRADLLSARRDLEIQVNRLKNLMTDDYGGWIRTSIDPTDRLLAVVHPFDLQESWRRGMELRPDLVQARESVERQNIILRYNKNQLLPSLDLQLTYGHNGRGGDLETGFDGIRTGRGQRYSYGLVLSFPWSNRTAKNNLSASRIEEERLILQLKQVEQNAMLEVDNALKTAGTAYDQIEATRQARLYAEAALDAEEKKLANGRSTSFVVLQLQRDLTAAKSRELRALADYNQALENLFLSEGTTIDRHQLTVEIK